jgi:hypothetical protein
MREVVSLIQHRRQEVRISPELDARYADLYDHVLRASEWTESLRDMITTVFETNLSLQDARLNMVMKKLTGWAAIIAVPTAITGFYGQNVTYPGIDTVVGFVTSSVIIVLLVAILYVMFKRRDWLLRRGGLPDLSVRPAIITLCTRSWALKKSLPASPGPWEWAKVGSPILGAPFTRSGSRRGRHSCRGATALDSGC